MYQIYLHLLMFQKARIWSTLYSFHFNIFSKRQQWCTWQKHTQCKEGFNKAIQWWCKKRKWQWGFKSVVLLRKCSHSPILIKTGEIFSAQHCHQGVHRRNSGLHTRVSQLLFYQRPHMKAVRLSSGPINQNYTHSARQHGDEMALCAFNQCLNNNSCCMKLTQAENCSLVDEMLSVHFSLKSLLSYPFFAYLSVTLCI